MSMAVTSRKHTGNSLFEVAFGLPRMRESSQAEVTSKGLFSFGGITSLLSTPYRGVVLPFGRYIALKELKHVADTD